MRTKEFTFKKTVKKSTTFNAISIDLTVDDARDLIDRLQRDALKTNVRSDMYNGLTRSLALFLAKHAHPHDDCPF